MPKKEKNNAFLFLVIGMAFGFLSGLFLFYNLDNTKGWNPFGWWLIATFFSTVIGAFGGLLFYAYQNKKHF